MNYNHVEALDLCAARLKAATGHGGKARHVVMVCPERHFACLDARRARKP